MMKILQIKWIRYVLVGLLSITLFPSQVPADDHLKSVERKPIIVLENSAFSGNGGGKTGITNQYGYLNPAFVLYDDGLVIFKKGDDVNTLYSVKLTQDEMKEFLEGFYFGDDFMRLADRYFVSDTFHPLTNILYYWRNGNLERIIRVFGNLKKNVEDRSRTPGAFLKDYDRIMSFDHEDIKPWLPDQFVISLSPQVGKVGPVPWPKDWPDLNHASTIKNPNNKMDYLMYLDGTKIDQFEHLFSFSEDRSVEINEKVWYINPMRHCMPAEEMWLNPPPYPEITYSKSGNYYVKSIREDEEGPLPNNRRKGKTYVYQIVDGKDVLQDTYDWYAMNVSLEGRSLVRFGGWAEGTEPNENDLAIAFYHAGQTLKEYSTQDIVKLGYQDKGKIEIMSSHYQVLNWPVGFKRTDSAGYSFDVKTFEGMILSFDAASGEFLKKYQEETNEKKNIAQSNILHSMKVVKDESDEIVIDVYYDRKKLSGNGLMLAAHPLPERGAFGFNPGFVRQDQNKGAVKISLIPLENENCTNQIEIEVYQPQGENPFNNEKKVFPFEKCWKKRPVVYERPTFGDDLKKLFNDLFPKTETFGGHKIHQYPKSAAVMGGSVDERFWFNILRRPITLNDALIGPGLLDAGMNMGTEDVKIDFHFENHAVVNSEGPDLILLDGGRWYGAYQISSDYDGFAQNYDLGRQNFMETGQSRSYYYATVSENKSYTSKTFYALIDLSDLGIPKDVSISTVRIGVNKGGSYLLGLGALNVNGGKIKLSAYLFILSCLAGVIVILLVTRRRQIKKNERTFP